MPNAAARATRQSSAITSRKPALGSGLAKFVQLHGPPVGQRPVFAGKHVSRQLELSCQSGEPRDGPFCQRPPAIPPVPAISRLIIGVIPLALLFRARPGRELVKTRVEFLGRRLKPPIKRLDINPGKPGPVFKAPLSALG